MPALLASPRPLLEQLGEQFPTETPEIEVSLGESWSSGDRRTTSKAQWNYLAQVAICVFGPQKDDSKIQDVASPHSPSFSICHTSKYEQLFLRDKSQRHELLESCKSILSKMKLAKLWELAAKQQRKKKPHSRFALNCKKILSMYDALHDLKLLRIWSRWWYIS